MNIILCHGILGFSRIGNVPYFRDVAEHFSTQGHRVIAPKVDPTRGVEFRGNQLRDRITEAFTGPGPALDPAQPTHIIGYSMGGLDARFMLSPANPERLALPVRSLTTISAPHRGSPVADLVDSPERAAIFRRLLEKPVETALGLLDLSLDGLRDLTTTRCREFNERFKDHPEIAYFSVAGSGHPEFPQTSVPLLPLHKYITHETGEANDGLVTVSSAQWGTFDPQTWPVDHGEAVGYDLNNLLGPAPVGHLERYDRILKAISN